MTQRTQEFSYHGSKPIRADRFLQQQLKGFSMANVRQLLGSGAILHNGHGCKKGTLLKQGESLLWPDMPNLSTLPIPNAKIPLSIAFEDEALLIAEKPSGLPTYPLSPLQTETLANALIAYHSCFQGVGNSPLEAGCVHRLDIKTSGLVVAAKSQKNYQRCRSLWQSGKVLKTYMALVQGNLESKIEIDQPLARHKTEKSRMVVVEPTTRPRDYRGPVLKAYTKIAPQQHYADFTLVKVCITTGIMHQIRLHLSSCGHPIVGEDLYNQPHANKPTWQRYFLHAAHIKLPHPQTNAMLEVASSLPTELDDFLQQLR